MSERYKVGDKVYFIATFREIYWELYTKTPPNKLNAPHEKKITQVVHAKNETLYQVKGGHFPESWIGRIVFDTMEGAEEALFAERPWLKRRKRIGGSE